MALDPRLALPRRTYVDARCQLFMYRTCARAVRREHNVYRLSLPSAYMVWINRADFEAPDDF